MRFSLGLFCILELCQFSVSILAKCKTTFHPVSTIDCSKMNATGLDENLVRMKDLTKVKKLIISHNELNSSVSFKDWNSLIALDASHNNIDHISAETFGPLTNLKLLNISFNGISIIDEKSFENITVLEILDLSGNRIIGSKYEAIQKSLNGALFRSVKKFLMRSANVSTLPSNAFKSALELEYLDLSENYIMTIPQLPKSLIYLRLSNNHIKTIDIVPFSNTNLLKDLYLDNNIFLSEIDIDAFENLRNLRNITFKGCKSLEYLPPRLFDFTKKLQYVSLADCNLRTLPYEYKHIFMNTPKIELENNPWVCNASIKWFAFLESSQDDEFRCNSPYNTTIADYYGATIRHGVLRNILIMLVLVVFVLFGLAIYISFVMERKRRVEMPYVPLEAQTNPLLNRVYVTTVV